MKTTWQKKLEKLLAKQYNDKEGHLLFAKYCKAFPTSYSEEFSPEAAVIDIAHLEQTVDQNQLQINFCALEKKSALFQLTLYHLHESIPLSDIMPMLENLDLRVFSEQSYALVLPNNIRKWLRVFKVTYRDKNKLHLEKVKNRFIEAFTHIYFDRIQNDSLNRLILKANLAWRDIEILRVYIKYFFQIEYKGSLNFVVQTLMNNSTITKDLVKLFKMRFDPDERERREENALHKHNKEISHAIQAVSILEEDLVLRSLCQLINASVRTNFFQMTNDKHYKEYVSIKFHSKVIHNIPLPKPLYEIFVFSKKFEGIHLRDSKVARGGIRVSERQEDFRKEILDLMKTQKLKNAEIVPSGAKGGFVIKPILPLQKNSQQDVINCYKMFIKGLLDLTDNIIKGKIVPPKNTICYDDNDPYLVVAADKGTSAFSDIANNIAEEYNFWLGDAFASGGSRGYDHKKIGITALGVWESVKRHFHELEFDFEKDNFKVVGIGDMSGDVFGNGMLYSKHILLVAAFDAQYIFLDPKPDPEISYKERLRLFKLSESTWKKYNKKLISVGGGVYDRKQKYISLSAEVKKILCIQNNVVTADELISAILKAPVDLLWNGGVGTFVKASTETNRDVGDKTNDIIRVNGKALRCRVVGEGGNLGFTQLGRIEYALKGGLVNADFIDNAGGVGCSDQEVNIKIVFKKALDDGEITVKKRDKLLSSMTNEVVELVVENNYYHALSISYMTFFSRQNMDFYYSYIQELENNKILDRSIDHLPDEKKIIRRKKLGLGLVKPEISTLLAYTKRYIKQEILKNNLFSDPYFDKIFKTAFPKKLRKSFKESIENHELRREIIATQICNEIINDMGPLFIYLLQIEAWATVTDIVRGYIVVSQVFKTNELQEIVNSLGYKIPLGIQYEILNNIKHLITISTRWFLRGNRLQDSIGGIIDQFSKNVSFLEKKIPELMTGKTQVYLKTLTDQFIIAGLSETLAYKLAGSRAIYNSLSIIEIAKQLHSKLTITANVYFAVGTHFNLVWFRDQLLVNKTNDYWDALTRLTLRSELDNIQKLLTVQIMKNNNNKQNSKELVNIWCENNCKILYRWDKMLEKIYESSNVDFSTYFIVITELSNMLQTLA